MRYRRRGLLNTRHFRSECSHWPADGTDYEGIEEWSGPEQGTLCNECRAKRDNERWPKAHH